MTPLLPLATVFATLSLLAFGGGNAVLPEMQRAIVVHHHWLTAPEFTALFGLAQAAPGPNLMIVTLLGWRLAGLPGALVTTLATFLPATALTIAALRLWDRHRTAPWRQTLQRALIPLTAGLVASSAIIMTRTAATTPLLLALALTAALLASRLHPLVLLSAAALTAAVLLPSP
jgi:chromate transporter